MKMHYSDSTKICRKCKKQFNIGIEDNDSLEILANYLQSIDRLNIWEEWCEDCLIDLHEWLQKQLKEKIK